MKKTIVLLIAIVAILGCKPKSERKKPATASASAAASENKTSASAQTTTADWVKVEGGTKRVNRDVFIDAATISDENGYRKAWVLFDNKGEPIVLGGGTTYLSKKTLYLFSCGDKSGAYTNESLHKEGMGRGEVVFSQTIDQPRWLPGVSGTVFEATIEAACKLEPRSSK
jgi:hypothetical protein